MSRSPLISSQRYLDPKKVRRKAEKFKQFIVMTLDIELRGKQYRILADGHHNLAAARLAGVEPVWRGPSKKLQRIMQSCTKEEFANFMINNLTDSDWYFVDTGEVVADLLAMS
jgi:hypothetical protein